MAFVTFEGIDGSGKTTQAKRLITALGERDIDVVAAKEPDGGQIGPEIRAILVTQRARRLDASEEAVLGSPARPDTHRSCAPPERGAGSGHVSVGFLCST